MNVDALFKMIISAPSKGEAEKILREHVEGFRFLYGTSMGDPEEQLRRHLGYWSGYYTVVEAQVLYDLLGISHPYLGTPDEWMRLTADEIFRKGVEMAERRGERVEHGPTVG